MQYFLCVTINNWFMYANHLGPLQKQSPHRDTVLLVHQARIQTDKACIFPPRKMKYCFHFMQYLLFIPTTVMDKVFHLLVLYGNLYTLEQRRKLGQCQWEQDPSEFSSFEFKHTEISMQEINIPTAVSQQRSVPWHQWLPIDRFTRARLTNNAAQPCKGPPSFRRRIRAQRMTRRVKEQPAHWPGAARAIPRAGSHAAPTSHTGELVEQASSRVK